MKKLALVGLFFLLAGCDSQFDAPTGELVYKEVAGGYAIVNNSDGEIFTFIVEEGLAAVINWRPGVSIGEGMPPAASQLLTRESLRLKEDEHRVIVNWWHAERVDGEWQPGGIGVFVLDF